MNKQGIEGRRELSRSFMSMTDKKDTFYSSYCIDTFQQTKAMQRIRIYCTDSLSPYTFTTCAITPAPEEIQGLHLRPLLGVCTYM